MTLTKVNSSEEFQQLVDNKSRFLFLKNSTTCPISMAAFAEYKKLANALEGESFYYLNVQEARPLSTQISETFGVKHESPQALLFHKKSIIWHDSHWNITYDLLMKKWLK